MTANHCKPAEWTDEFTASELRPALRAYLALNCEGREDCDRFYGDPSGAKPCGHRHEYDCNPGGQPFFPE